MTYEASIEMSEESGLEQIDEDEWTDRNFGNSTANDVNTSDDSISDLESDDDDERGIKVVNLMILYCGFNLYLYLVPCTLYQGDQLDDLLLLLVDKYFNTLSRRLWQMRLEVPSLLARRDGWPRSGEQDTKVC